jgi:hypothetical protein
MSPLYGHCLSVTNIALNGLYVVDQVSGHLQGKGKVLKLKHDFFLNPKMKNRSIPYVALSPYHTHTRSRMTLCIVHVISGDLILHKRTLEPIKIIYGFRRYDVDRCAALVDTSGSR